MPPQRAGALQSDGKVLDFMDIAAGQVYGRVGDQLVGVAAGGGGGGVNIDGGAPESTYGGVSPLDGGGPS